ncbi:hypothetical protein [Halomonas sp. H5]|uniref:hypothetical protein n=1 Tax=Halomonas sp. H5 TaxID=3423910 RepID=UPI003D359BA4
MRLLRWIFKKLRKFYDVYNTKRGRLVVNFILLAPIPVLFYVFNFKGFGVSDDPGDWASFGAYMSGTVGVIALLATIDALIVTISQQDKLLDQQERQISSNDSHQRRMAAYSRAEKVFPLLLENRRSELGENACQWMKSVGLAGDFFTAFPVGTTFRDLLKNPENAKKVLDIDAGPSLAVLANKIHYENYQLLIFIKECLEDAEELKGYYLTLLGDDKVLITSTLAFYREWLEDVEYARLVKLFGVLDLSILPGAAESYWAEVGAKVKSSNVSVSLPSG